MKITYVTIKNPHMRTAYNIAKSLYLVRKWNKKTIPVCIIAKDDELLSFGVGGNGLHQVAGDCDRLLASKGSAYGDCKWCDYPVHAERNAINMLRSYPFKAVAYMYGHYKVCEECKKALKSVGIEHVILLKNADVLFNRHNPKSVVGKEEQFKL